MSEMGPKEKIISKLVEVSELQEKSVRCQIMYQTAYEELLEMIYKADIICE